MTSQQLTSLVHKELLESMRSASVPVLISVSAAILMQVALLRRIAHAGSPLQLTSTDSAAAAPLVLAAPLVIPVLGMMLIQRRFLREQVRGSLVSLLCTGISVGDVWLAKVLSGFAVGYLAAILILAMDGLIITLWFGSAITWSGSLLVLLFVLGPLISLLLLAVMSFVAFAVRTAAIGGMLPAVLVVFLQMYWRRLIVRGEIVASGAFVAAVCVIVTLCLLKTCLDRLPKRYLLRI
jgi:hypothetical protein